MGKSIFFVTNPSGQVNEYFLERESAVAFIVDEFSMTLAFRDDNEGDRLTEYMETHNETPNQYPYKLFVKEIGVNHDYDKPKSVWVVSLSETNAGVESEKQFLFYSLEDAQERFDELVDEDINTYGDVPNAECSLNEKDYYRLDSEHGSIVNHLHITLKEFVEETNSFKEKETH